MLGLAHGNRSVYGSAHGRQCELDDRPADHRPPAHRDADPDPGYSSPFPTPAECRGVIKFPQQLVVPEPDPALGPPDPDAVAALRAKPAMPVEGMRDTALIPRHTIPAFPARLPR